MILSNQDSISKEREELMVVLINYADKKFEHAQKYCSRTGKGIGGCDEVWQYNPKSIQTINSKFYTENRQWFVEGNPQIGKYGLWRPIIVKDAFTKLK